MSKKNEVFDFKLKEGSTPEDLQKIQILQNHAIIRLLALTSNVTEAIFNNIVVDDYKEGIRKFVDVKEPVIKKQPEQIETSSKNTDDSNVRMAIGIVLTLLFLAYVVFQLTK
jgi:hypothetical protein